MPAAAAKSKAKAPTRAELARELLEIERDNPTIFARIAEIKTLLKLQADIAGSFRETFPNLGWVSVSPSKPASTIGEAPAINVEAWSGLKASRRERLLEEGWIKMEPLIKGASYGQVRTQLHAPPKGAST